MVTLTSPAHMSFRPSRGCIGGDECDKWRIVRYSWDTPAQWPASAYQQAVPIC
jgi:hypothetical protein